MKVFLGGTCNGSEWREEVTSSLKLDYFDPRVGNWTEEAYLEELNQRRNCDFLLYVITPKMHGYYSIAEAVDDSNKFPEKTIFCLLTEDGDHRFTQHQLNSLSRIKHMVHENGAQVIESLDGIVRFLNAHVIYSAIS